MRFMKLFYMNNTMVNKVKKSFISKGVSDK